MYPHALSADYDNSKITYLCHKTLCSFTLYVSDDLRSRHKHNSNKKHGSKKIIAKKLSNCDILTLLQLDLVHGSRTKISNRIVLRFSTLVRNYLFSKSTVRYCKFIFLDTVVQHYSPIILYFNTPTSPALSMRDPKLYYRTSVCWITFS